MPRAHEPARYLVQGPAGFRVRGRDSRAVGSRTPGGYPSDASGRKGRLDPLARARTRQGGAFKAVASTFAGKASGPGPAGLPGVRRWNVMGSFEKQAPIASLRKLAASIRLG